MIIIDDIYTLEDFNMRALNTYDDPITFPFSDSLYSVINNDITLLVNEQIEPRPLSIPIKVRGRSHIDLEDIFNKFSDLFYDDFGKRKLVKISLDHWGGRFVNAYLADNLHSDRLRGLANFNLNLICYDPFRYSPVTADEVSWGSEKIDFKNTYYTLGHEGSPAEMQVSGSSTSTFDLTVNGLVVYPKIIIEGSSGELKISANGQSVTLPAFNNAKWEIERFNSTRNGQEVFVNARKFHLKPGRNRVSMIGNNKNFKISMRYRDRYK